MFLILCRGKNNILIPVVLDRLQSYHPQLCEELKNIQSLRPLSFEDDSEPDPEDISISGPKKRSNFICFALRACHTSICCFSLSSWHHSKIMFKQTA